jgi:hypothetical protein
VKRQLWRNDPKTFLAQVGPVISSYVEKQRKTSVASDFAAVAKVVVRQRRKAPEVDELVQCVGTEFPLYLAVLQELRAGFLRTGDPGYGALRADLLLALNESGVTQLSRLDPCLRFCRVLSGCAGVQREVDGPRARELVNTAAEAVKSAGSGAVLGDLGMTLMDPPVQHMLLANFVDALQKTVHVRFKSWFVVGILGLKWCMERCLPH